MSKQPSPRLDALRAMREAEFAKVPKVSAPKPKKGKPPVTIGKVKPSHGSKTQAAKDAKAGIANLQSR